MSVLEQLSVWIKITVPRFAYNYRNHRTFCSYRILWWIWEVRTLVGWKHVCHSLQANKLATFAITFGSQYWYILNRTLHTTFTFTPVINWLMCMKVGVFACVWTTQMIVYLTSPVAVFFAVGRSVWLEAPEWEGMVWITLVSFRSLKRPVGAALHDKAWMFKSCHHLTATVLTETAFSILIFWQRSASARKGCYFWCWLDGCLK